ncbi:lactoylglutathione lyase [Galdieria sulphuraria]|uniref:lactoylglutathione lyase n=1 Tax=Galdieria sulphuraria TaxID=130081 RepID=M2WU10_GALSU|nr:lactoylglutathione lyase [Galdieria sulphuraria]EME27390.1 lactoylglutathione lyase [Galdieria sulphuraria]|eukprot:XP_005703910.1 lactoylglutathione lyase [Galdieria sulphuraria]
MLRIKDPKKSRTFYEKQLGMQFLTRFDFPSLAFSLYFYASTEQKIPNDHLSQAETAKWLWNVQCPTLELTYNWGTEKDSEFHYHNGNEDPKGFVHVTFVVNDVKETVEELQSQGVPVIQHPSHSEIGKCAYVSDPDGYWIQLVSGERKTGYLYSNTKSVDDVKSSPVLAETMLRIKDPAVSKEFYEKGLGMNFLGHLEIPSSRSTVYYYGYANSSSNEIYSMINKFKTYQWTIPRMALQYLWDSESDSFLSYHNGNSEPKGFGHIGLTVDDIYGACYRIQKAGYKIIRKPGPFQDVGEIAFVSDPDGYWIELIQRSSLRSPKSAL